MSLSRRKFIKSAGITALGVSAISKEIFSKTSAKAEEIKIDLNSERPNILWILAEDMSPNLGCYGEPLIKTPNLDKLASEGIRFTHAHTTAPVCSASRSALVTGMYQTSCGTHNHRTFDKKPLPDGIKPITHYLMQAGYFTCNLGDKKIKPSGSKGSGKTDFNFSIDKVYDGVDWTERKEGQPFFATISLQESHKGYGWELAQKQKYIVDPTKVKLPPYYPDHKIARDEYANYLNATMLVDTYVGELMSRLETEGLAKNTVVIFMGDNGQCLFRGKQFLYDGGTSVPLIVRYPDKRYSGKVEDKFVLGIDISAAILGLAGITSPTHLHGKDFLNSKTPERDFIITARDRCDIAIERMRCVRTKEFSYIRNFMPGIPYMQRNPYKERDYPTWNLVKELNKKGELTKEQALFAADGKPIEELYNLKNDPNELSNLANQKDYNEKLLEMRIILNNWIKESGDMGATFEDPVPVYEAYFKGSGKGQ
jgi:N-sulfoglucosamine sulfohydrolase